MCLNLFVAIGNVIQLIRISSDYKKLVPTDQPGEKTDQSGETQKQRDSSH